MSTAKPAERANLEIAWEEVARALFAARGVDSGLWHLAVKVRFSATTMTFEVSAPDGTPIMPKADMPAGIVGMQSLVLVPVEKPGLMVFDAARTLPPAAPAKKLAQPAAKKRASARRTAP